MEMNGSALPSSIWMLPTMAFSLPSAGYRWTTSFDLESQSLARLSDHFYFVALAVFFWGVRSILDRSVFDPIARRFLLGPSTLRPSSSSTASESTSCTSSPSSCISNENESKSSGSKKTTTKRKKKSTTAVAVSRSSASSALTDGSSRPSKADTAAAKKKPMKKTSAMAKSKEEEDEKATTRALLKFKESAWKLLYYSSAEMIVLYITYNEPWFGNTRAFWEGWPLQGIKLKLKAYYMYAGGFCLYSCFALLFWDARRSDFFATVCHHSATISLIMFSYVSGFARVGSVVLALHDINDIFLESAKIFVYTKVELGSTIFFSLFVVSWIATRLIYFPFWIIYSTSYEVLQVVDSSKHPSGPFLYYSCNSLLITLLVLHIYWWALIFRMLMRMLKNKGEVGDDVRSDSEDD